MRAWRGSWARWLVLCVYVSATAQLFAQKPIDEWQALDLSLRTAKSIHPAKGFVPDELTAIKIAEAAAIAQYGEPKIAGERPFRARLKGNVWTVHGTLHPQGALGGTAVVKLLKTDGRIIFMVHQH